jgi:hypothetical protein
MVINYLSEVMADETIQIATGPGGDHSQLIQGTRERDGKAMFRTRMDWGI